MRRSFALIAVLYLVLPSSLALAADPAPRALPRDERILHGGPADPAKSLTDTTVLIGPWGSGAAHNGQFETAAGDSAWNGWTHEDWSVNPYGGWHVSVYNAAYLHGNPAGNLAAFCGEEEIPLCPSQGDTIGGYGNNYREVLQWVGTVADPTAGCRIDFDGWLNIDIEPAYDYLYLRVLLGDGGFADVESFTGKSVNLNLVTGYDLSPGDYTGPAGNEVHLQLLMISDGAFSDADCMFPSKGAVQLDDVTVTLDNGGTVSYTDFEDGTLGDWAADPTPGVGDFAHLRENLEDIDPCLTNSSWQVCFVDDGVVVPGTGGTFCNTWCYGPNGYILNNDGGLSDGSLFLRNYVLSPVVAWPGGGRNSGGLELDAYLHADYGINSPGIFADVRIRAVNTGNPEDLQFAGWQGFSMIYFFQGYRRLGWDIGHQLPPDVTHVQVAMGAYELGWVWGIVGDDGTPAPYFDNVRLTAYRHSGPRLTARPRDLAADAFPASGEFDLENPGANSVRFDMAANIHDGAVARIVQGDSIVCGLDPAGRDCTLAGLPQLFYKLKRNTFFDPYRTADLPDMGWVNGDSVRVGTSVISNRFAFDLPDEGFLFPGDELHYYLEATQYDPVLGLTTSLLPADTTGFSTFGDITSYDPVFSVRALPTYDETADTIIRALVWDDAVTTDQLPLWEQTLDLVNGDLQSDYDFYFSNTADASGLGHAATVAQLDRYDWIIYNSGGQDPPECPLGDGTEEGGLSPDLQLLTAWLELGGKGLLLCGDQILYSLTFSQLGNDFLNMYVGLTPVSDDLAPLVNGQISPVVAGVAGTELYPFEWMAYGGCPTPRRFSAMVPAYGAVRLAEFLSPVGQGGLYPYAAAAGMVQPAVDAQVASLPYALERIGDVTAPVLESGAKVPPPAPMSVEVLKGLLIWLEVPWDPVYPVPDAGVLSAVGYPNPFNPSVRIDYAVPQDGRVQIEVFNLKGEKVRTLLDEVRPAGAHHAAWDGRDGEARQVASGVYFYRVTAGDASVLGKLTLVK